MKGKSLLAICFLILQLLVIACTETNRTKKPIPAKNTTLQTTMPTQVQKKSRFEELLKKFKPISFDTLQVFYTYGDQKNRFLGQELPLKDALNLPFDKSEYHHGSSSEVYACYQFSIDSNTIGLIARVPSIYESSSVLLFLFDIKKDIFLEANSQLSENIGDAGDYYQKITWLYRTKDKQIHSFVYDYSSYSHEVEDTADHTLEEWRKYCLINCTDRKFDTLSSNEIQLKKKFKKLLKMEI